MTIKLNEMTVACVKLKLPLPNVVIRDGSGTPGISKVGLVVAIASHFNFTLYTLHFVAIAFNFCRSMLDLRRL